MSDAPEGFIEIENRRLIGLKIIDGSISNITYVSRLLGVNIKYGSTVHFLIYFPENGDIYLTADLVVKKNIDKRTGMYDENMILRNFLYNKRKVGNPLTFPTIEEYQHAKENDELNESEENIWRVLSLNKRYFMHIEEPEIEEPDE
jgi:hypothetical protein